MDRNRCVSCKGLFAGHRACPHCGGNGYQDLDSFAGLVIRGETYKHRQAIKATGALYDAHRREWIVPRGITAQQYDALNALLDNRKLRCGFYDNPADYDVSPAPQLAH